MLFGRRHRASYLGRAREVVWPRSGARRAGTYLAHRVRRLPGTPYSIAAGLACGAAVSFTPFMGLHFVLGAVLALVIRGNIVASAIGTAVGNPWTFPLIWSLIYNIGRALLGMGEGAGVSPDLTLSEIANQPMELLTPMLVGAVPTALAAWTVFFFPVYLGVRRYQAIRQARRHRLAGQRRRVRLCRVLAALGRRRRRDRRPHEGGADARRPRGPPAGRFRRDAVRKRRTRG